MSAAQDSPWTETRDETRVCGFFEGDLRVERIQTHECATAVETTRGVTTMSASAAGVAMHNPDDELAAYCDYSDLE